LYSKNLKKIEILEIFTRSHKVVYAVF